MKIQNTTKQSGIALIIVMIVITVLSMIVAGFSYSMKVETRLAKNAAFDPEMDWLGRSGVELAKYLLGVQRTIPGENTYDALNQKWAGAMVKPEHLLADVSLDGNQIGKGTVSVKITDCDRKFNINVADPMILEHSLVMIGVDASDALSTRAAILDWIDEDDRTTPGGGAEKDYYEALSPAYICKNGPIDDINELLLIKGIFPEMFWGPRYTGPRTVVSSRRKPWRVGQAEEPDVPAFTVGLVDLFSPFGGRTININTASSTVLQVIPEIDENIATAILQMRAGQDGSDGTDDDIPFRSLAQLASVPGIPPPLVGQISRYFTFQSTTFDVEVNVQLAERKRTFYAIVRRVNQNTLQTLNLWSK